MMKKEKDILGWREWVSLPDLDLLAIKAKVDTGAKTSSLHAFDIKTFKKSGHLYTKFKIHPLQDSKEVIVNCQAKVVDERVVSDSGGHKEKRLVILTPIMIGKHVFETEITLSDRESMHFRMLLGRATLKKKFLVNPQSSFKLGQTEIQEKFLHKLLNKLS
ncbi:MAG: ATP-dependent zinc protease [Bacteriovoracaceae bacterium]